MQRVVTKSQKNRRSRVGVTDEAQRQEIPKKKKKKWISKNIMHKTNLKNKR